jgi:translation initiation factor 2 beta subunit (eIF-2beta)/eIF-5
MDLYHDGTYQWQNFYKSYDRFKTAFDAERNRIYHIHKFGSQGQLPLAEATPVAKPLEQRELTEEEKVQVFQRDSYTCQCCGKKREKGRKVRFEVDHITPFRFGGETSLNNSQTLCSICHKDKSVNAVNFRILRSPLAAPKGSLDLKRLSAAEYIEEELKRIVNMFYYCKAVAHINWDYRPRSKYRYQWEIILFEGNKPEWLAAHKEALLAYTQQQGFPLLTDIIIR